MECLILPNVGAGGLQGSAWHLCLFYFRMERECSVERQDTLSIRIASVWVCLF